MRSYHRYVYMGAIATFLMILGELLYFGAPRWTKGLVHTTFGRAKPAQLSDVFLVFRTGATEMHAKLPAHVNTTLTLAEHAMIFADVSQEFAGYTIHDALESVSQETKSNNNDFRIYHQIQQHREESALLQELPAKEAWTLDKYKWLPTIHRATVAMQTTDAKWMVIVEADTSLSWTNLLRWLGSLDASKPHYLGARNFVFSDPFSHGGSGVVISLPALQILQQKRLAEGAAKYDSAWEARCNTPLILYGDLALGLALKEAGVAQEQVWPVLQGEQVSTMGWDKQVWCRTPISWHHNSPEEIDALWRFERDWISTHGPGSTFFFRDIFEHFVKPYIGDDRRQWNNLAQRRKLVHTDSLTPDDKDLEKYSELNEQEQEATRSSEACAVACANERRFPCIQWAFTPGRCHLDHLIRFGKSTEQEGTQWTSGWIRDQVASTGAQMMACTP